MSVKVIKGNRVLDVPEHHIEKFMARGYELYDKKTPASVAVTPPKQEPKPTK